MPLPADAARLFHGRGGLHAGCEHWTLDFYPPVLVLTSFQPVPDEELATIGTALAARWEQLAPGQPLNWVFQTRLEGRADTRLMAGSVPEQHAVGEDGTRYFVHVLRGQNHGLFLDMAEGRRWVRALATSLSPPRSRRWTVRRPSTSPAAATRTCSMIRLSSRSRWPWPGGLGSNVRPHQTLIPETFMS